MIFDGIASVIGSLISSITNYKTTDQTNKANQQINESTNAANAALAAQQNEWNVQQWERNNEYNSPVAQLQRLRDAGLNENMMYGSGASSIAVSDPAQSADLANQQSYQRQAPHLSDLGASLLAASQFRLQEKKTKHEIIKLDAESESVKAQTQLFEKQFELTDEQTKQVRASTANLMEGLEQLKLQNAEKRFNNRKLKERYDREVKLFDHNIKESLSRIGLNEQQVHTLSAAAVQSLATAKNLDAQNVLMKLANEVISKVDREKLGDNLAVTLQSILDATNVFVGGLNSVLEKASSIFGKKWSW